MLNRRLRFVARDPSDSAVIELAERVAAAYSGLV